ncbi:hypothetical protein EAE99_004707 [Botrytis elliptica]|nr:hypothetical protein EAE99_004707 [Botrytis elliptica]
MHIAHGCKPYSAVDGYGNTSGGLQDSGDPTGFCNDPQYGQTYVRGGWSGGRYGIMYAWYWPKDHPAAGNLINNPEVANPVLIGAAASGHGGVSKTTNPPRQGTRPKVEYFVEFPKNHALQFTNTPGVDLPMI